jgi:hypothetical protein
VEREGIRERGKRGREEREGREGVKGGEQGGREEVQYDILDP